MMKIKWVNNGMLLVVMLAIYSCGGENISETYRLNKKIWDIEDYDNAIRKIKYAKKDEKKPSYSSPEKSIIFMKMIDRISINVVLKDEELGVSHRAKHASGMFKQYQKMLDLYQDVDREDRYLYSAELIDVLQFGLYLQLDYFDLGNREIVENADDPEGEYIVRLLKNNEEVIVSNYCIYLDFVKEEKALSDEARKDFIAGINSDFTNILTKFPDANYDKMRNKANLMLNKTESKEIKEALNLLISKLDKLEASNTEMTEMDSVEVVH